jgi:hypothetical protein
MHKLSQACEVVIRKNASHVVLDGLHVVFGGCFKTGNCGDVVGAKVVDDLAKRGDGLGWQWRGSRHTLLAQRDEPLKLYSYSSAIERCFGKVFP